MIVIIESPLAGKGETPEEKARDVIRNQRYARACMRDSLRRGEAPFASHLLYAQEGILDDLIVEERELGIRAGHRFLAVAHLVAVYCDLGISGGMLRGIARAQESLVKIEHRHIPEWM